MPPVNDNFASATVLTGTSGSVTFTNVGATTETGESVDADGYTVWFKWTAPTTHPQGYAVSVDTAGSPYPPHWDSFLNIYEDSDGTLGGLGYITSDDDSSLQVGDPGPYGTSLAQFWADAGATYYFQVDGWNPAATHPAAVLRFAAAPHTIGPWVQPADHTVSTTGNSGRNGYSSTGPATGTAASNTTMWAGTGTVTQDQTLVPTYRTEPTSTGFTAAYTAVEVLNYDRANMPGVVDDPNPIPADFVSLEYDPTDANTLTSDVSLHLETATHTLDWGSYPTDLGVSVRRIPTTGYQLVTDVPSLPSGVAWWTPAVVSAWTEVVDITHGTPGGGFTTATDLTFTSSDSDSNGCYVLWFGIDYYPSATVLPVDLSGFPAVTPQIEIRATVSFTYRPRRHRYIYPAPYPTPGAVVAVTEVWAHVEGSLSAGTEVWG